MERENRKPTENIQPRSLTERAGKFVNNKIARAAVAVTLPFAAAFAVEKTIGYDVFPNVEVAHADGPNLLPNPSFETDNSGVPQGYEKIYPALMGADYPSSSGAPFSGLKDVSSDNFGSNSDCTSNGWRNAVKIPVDVSKYYRISFSARSDILGLDQTEKIRPITYIEFYDINNSQIFSSVGEHKYVPTLSEGNWERFNSTMGPASDVVPPSGTKSIKIEFNNQNFKGPSDNCAQQNVIYATETYDDVSFTEMTPTVLGGVDEDAKLDKPQAISSAKKDNDNNTLPIAAGVAGAAIVAGGALAYSRRRRS